MLGSIIGFLVSVAVVLWLVSIFGLLVIIVPVCVAAAMIYAESGGQWFVFIPAALVIALVAWIDSKIS
jgi:hypothetical protein